MERKEFPKWKYHKTKSPVVVKTKAEEDALGKGWADSPTAFAVAEPPKKLEPIPKG